MTRGVDAEPRPPHQRGAVPSKWPEIWVTLAIVAAAIMVLLWWVPRAGSSGSRAGLLDAGVPFRASQLPPADELRRWYELAHRMGPEAAPLRIIEFGNFGCEFCRRLYHAFDTILARYPGLVSMRWLHHVPANDGPNVANRLLAIGAECAADQGQFEAYYNVLFTAERLPVSRAELVAVVGESVVPDRSAYVACLDSGQHEETVDAHREIVAARGYSLTPTWFLNDRLIVGAAPVTLIDSMVLSVLRPAAAGN